MSEDIEPLLDPFAAHQKKYLVALAIAEGDKVKAMQLSGMDEAAMMRWQADVFFREMEESIQKHRRLTNVVRAWAKGNLAQYLEALHWLATLSKSEAVRLEAIKYLLGLAGTETTEKSDLTVIEKYLAVGNKEITKVARVRSA